uniref:Solute carrier family 43 member 3b n=1 Tax=Tetraodon nigroviridis TaxID=99883 RepID=H3D6G5_TETNG
VFGRNLSVQHCLTFATGLVECLCFAGAVFGWASLVFVLKSENYFSSLCVNTTEVNGTQVLDCSRQDEQFSLVFTIASFMNNFMTLLSGFLFDHFGTMVTRFCAITFYTMATLMLAFASPGPALSNLLFPALSFMAVGGVMFLITNMQVGNLFGSHRSTIITLYNGAFDSSSALLLIIKLLYESGISLRTSFLFLSACSTIHLLRTFLLLPRRFIPYPLPDDYTYGVTCGKSQGSESRAENRSTENGPEETAVNRSAPQAQVRSFRQCFLSWFFLWHLVWLSVMQLRHYFFIGTLNPMLQHLTKGDPALVSRYTNAFAITQLCGVLCAPWNGLIMDRHKGKPRAEGQIKCASAGESEQEADLRASVLSLFVTALQCVLFSVCATATYLPLQYLTFILQVINRSFLYGGNAAFISVAFPSCHFGKLYGMVLALSAVFAVLQYPCFALVKGALNGDPLYVNIGLTLFSLLAFIHPLNVYRHCRKLSAQRGAS